MSASRGLRLSALAWMILGAVAAPAVSSAQVIDPIFEHFGIARDPLARTPRLVGLGTVALVSDRNNHLTLWDFARNPAGLHAEDTTSTIDIRPVTESRSGTQTVNGDQGPAARQNLGARTNLVGYEFFRRTPKRNAYGFYGDLASQNVDTPFAEDIGRSAYASTPGGSIVLDGPVPMVKSHRMIYAMRVSYLKQASGDRYRRMVTNPTGGYLDLRGDELPPPNFFDPDEHTITATAVGTSFAYDFGPWLTASVGGEGIQAKVRSSNTDLRYESGRGGTRPYGIGQATLAGRIGKDLSWIADGRTWQASNEERWNFTLAASITQPPLTGRGTLLKRYEEGSQFRTRARWIKGAIELNGEIGTWYQQVRITPPAVGDPTSFNAFRNTIPGRVNADSLVIPDSIVRDTRDLRDMHVAFGGAWRLLGDRALLVAEYHSLTQEVEQVSTGAGPELHRNDVRTGLEYRCTPLLTARFGYVYRTEDLDDFTARNEYVRQSLTAGFSVRPRNASWDLAIGALHEWSRPDFDSPTDLRETREQVAMQVRWDL